MVVNVDIIEDEEYGNLFLAIECRRLLRRLRNVVKLFIVELRAAGLGVDDNVTHPIHGDAIWGVSCWLY